jgi:hypothetical protein
MGKFRNKNKLEVIKWIQVFFTQTKYEIYLKLEIDTIVQSTMGPANYCFQHVTVFNTLLCPGIFDTNKMWNIVKNTNVSVIIFLEE